MGSWGDESFTAEQAAQKWNRRHVVKLLNFTAEQAAQKFLHDQVARQAVFTAEQAAQKIKLIVMAYR